MNVRESSNTGASECADHVRTRRWLRVDLIVACLALLVSAVTTVGTWYQTKIIHDQLSSSVWPYVSFATNVDSGGKLSFVLTNDGTGPAIIRGVLLTVGRDRYTTLRAALAALRYHRQRHTADRLIHASTITCGEVVRPAQEIMYLAFTDPAVAKRIRANLNLVGIRICYCSILGSCWTANSNDDDEPASVPDCKSFDRRGIETAL